VPKRTHDIIGGPSLAVWLAMVAVVTVAWAAIPDWHIPDGTGLPRHPGGCTDRKGVEFRRCLGGRHRIAVDLGFHASAPFYFFFG
jgi:hypothetical protein